MAELFHHKGSKKGIAVLLPILAVLCLLVLRGAGLPLQPDLKPAPGQRHWSGKLPGQEPQRYFMSPTMNLSADTVYTSLVTKEDSIPNDTLFQLRAANGMPVAYYRKVTANVCFDNKCRLLRVRVYWNITGRYLGLELTEKEFLSKTDHDPFNPDEYLRLNELLADSLSPLANYTLEELVPGVAKGTLQVDAITAPTAPAVADHVIPGAAYTTLRLWHIVYGPSREAVIRLTEKALSPKLLLEILKSPDTGDRIWALRRTDRFPEKRKMLNLKVAELISDSDFSTSMMVLDKLNPHDLEDDSLQLALLQRFYASGYTLKNSLIDKLKAAPSLNPRLRLILAKDLKNYQGALFENILELYELQQVSDPETCRHIAALLKDENKFISRKAFEFLSQSGVADAEISEQLRQYR